MDTPAIQSPGQDSQVEQQSDVLQRVNAVLGYFSRQAAGGKGGSKTEMYGRILQTLAAEAVEEMAEVPDEMLAYYMGEAAAIIYWASTGERIVNLPLPRDFLLTVPKQLLGAGNDRPALPAGSNESGEVDAISE